ncbi:MAG: isoprenylcysteine carboxylmethyltransferase family protein [Candidatus Micrarchaeota archaeon]|nr:isoprenylcysteine carboxylmethyltransferase family protein [Candidatus Micrarchaeota archaeon]
MVKKSKDAGASLSTKAENADAKAGDLANLKKKIIVRFAAAPIAMALLLFLPAGTFDYWQAWVFCAVLFIPMTLLIAYFLKTDPELLARRIKMKEKESTQKNLMMLSIPVFLIAIMLPGLDRRFGWSSVPFEIVIAADIVIFLGYLLFFLVLRENHYAARTVEVEKGQKVISTGPYSVVRHPMYVSMFMIWLLTPLALGSYWAVIPFLIILPVIVLRILNEEQVLRRDLPGYNEYCEKTRYRLVPFVW